MKTLDEVIKVFSEVNKEVGCGDCQFNDAESDDIPCEMTDCIFADTLHYLKEYRSDKLQYEADRKLWEAALFGKVKECEEARARYIAKLKELDIGTLNDPLTWDELKQMKGKPVWVEAESLSVGVSPYWKDWYIIKSFSNDEFMYCNDGFEWAKEMQGRLWQAYRKERK